MLGYLARLLAVVTFFGGAMALLTLAHGGAHAQFVPYHGPYQQQPPPPPHPLVEVPPNHPSTLRWEAGRWVWVGGGYRWMPGHLSPNVFVHITPGSGFQPG